MPARTGADLLLHGKLEGVFISHRGIDSLGQIPLPQSGVKRQLFVPRYAFLLYPTPFGVGFSKDEL